MNKIILLQVLLHIVSTLGRICHSNETCVALIECESLVYSTRRVRMMNRCDHPRKYCCPLNLNGPTIGISTQKFPEGCGSTPMYEADRVMGGRLIEPDEFSWMATLEYGIGGATSGICSGAVINSRYVLTAAHCVTGFRIRERRGAIAVRLGDFQYGQKCDYGTPRCQHFQRFAIEEIVIHRDYKEDDRTQLLHDISLLRLNRPIAFSSHIQPICLPFGNNQNILEPSGDTWITIAGWGRTSSYSDATAKRAVLVPVWQKDRCLSDTRRTDSQICAGIAGKGSCHGDSGGPLMNEFESKRMVLEGIISYGGLECGTESFPGVSTRVRSYANWIDVNIRM